MISASLNSASVVDGICVINYNIVVASFQGLVNGIVGLVGAIVEVATVAVGWLIDSAVCIECVGIAFIPCVVAVWVNGA